MSKIFSACGVLFAVAVAVAPLHARAAPPSRVVAFGDLNLETDTGARVLLRRIAIASHMVCRESTGSYDLLTVPIYRSCVDRAIKRSVAQVGSERLTRVYRRDSIGLQMARK